MSDSLKEVESRPSGVIKRLLWSGVSGIAIAVWMTTALTLFAEYHWVSDLLANLRVQQCLAIFVAALSLLACHRWVWLGITLVCLAIHLPWFFTPSPMSNAPSAQVEGLTITLANVAVFNSRHDAILRDLLNQDADVLVILELNFALAERMNAAVESAYIHSIVRPSDDGSFGIGLYSRHPIEEHEVFSLNTGIESISALLRFEERSWRVMATHPLPPMGRRGFQQRNEHLQELANLIREGNADSRHSTVLVGDLNVTPWSPHFSEFQNTSGLRRATVGFDLTPTWYRFPAFPFGLVLDHAMVSSGMQCVEHSVGPAIGSDHRSVTVRLVPSDRLERESQAQSLE